MDAARVDEGGENARTQDAAQDDDGFKGWRVDLPGFIKFSLENINQSTDDINPYNTKTQKISGMEIDPYQSDQRQWENELELALLLVAIEQV